MPSIKGTASVTDDHAMAKLLKKTNFPANFSTEITLSKINIPVMSQWVERRITELLGFDDEIVASTAINLFLPTSNPAFDAPTVPPKIDPKRAQLNLAGFLGEEDAATFCAELWTLLVDAQSSPTGIPRKLLEETKKEMAVSRQQAQRPRPNSAVMNPFVREASRRAEAARQVLANVPPPPPPPENVPAAAAAAAPVQHDPVPVSPTHPSERPPTPPVHRTSEARHHPSPPPRDQDRARLKRDDKDESPRYQRNDSYSRRERHSRRDRSDSESSSSSASSASSYDSEEDRRQRRRERERRRRYEEDDDRHYRRSRDHHDRGEDEYGRRRRYDDRDRRPDRYRDRDAYRRRDRSPGHRREHHHRERHRRDRSRDRSYDRDDRRRRRHRRSRSYSHSS